MDKEPITLNGIKKLKEELEELKNIKRPKIVEAIAEAGMVIASSPRLPTFEITQPLTIYRGNSLIAATPAEKFGLVGVIDFPYPAIGTQ